VSYGVNGEPQRIRQQVQHFIKIGRYDKARSVASELISKYPEYPYGYYDMSLCEYYHERIDNSIELCYKALESGMAQVPISIMLMLYYNEKSDFKNVDKHYELIKTLAPACNDALSIYGYSLCKRGKEKEGVTILEEAFANDSTNSIIIQYLFIAAKRSKNKAQKEELLKLYMNSGVSEKRKLLFAGKYNVNIKKWKEAKECFARVIAIDPINKEAIEYMRIIELRHNLPLASLFFILFTFAVYDIKFDYRNLLTYIYFIPSICGFLLIGAAIYKLRKL